MNILDLVKSQLGTQGVEAIAGLLGENTANAQIATSSSAATILATLMQQAGSNNGAGVADILKLITSGNHNGGIFDNLSGLLGNQDGLNSLTNSGGGIINSLLGNKSNGIIDLIANISGIKSSSAGSLLSMAAPLVLGMLGKNVGSGGASGLLNLLMGQGDAVKAALPTGLSSLLGFNNFDPASVLKAVAGGSVAKATSTVSNTAQAAQNQVEDVIEAGSTNWLPWIIGALGLLAALWYFKGCGDKSNEIAKAKAATEAAAKMAKAKADSLANYAKNAIGGFKFADGSSISFDKGSIEDDLITFINDKSATIDKTKWFNFEGLNFDTGKATLQAGSETKLANIVAIMKAFPAVALKVGGYTDNQGKEDANMKLSAARAKTVMAELVSRGIDATRLKSEGYGPQHPVGDNTTDAGRAQNRRIDVNVTAK